MTVRPVVIDTDSGVDDALALLLAFRSPEVRIVGVTTVAGNVEVHRCTRNAERVVRYARRDERVTVVPGARRPLRLPLVTAPEVHGPGGLGSLTPRRADAVRSDEAAGRLCEWARMYGRRLTVVAIGPLTNVARAIRRDPRAMKSIGRLVTMGGAVAVPGNTGPVAEFNYYVDPHAVQEVFRSGIRTLIVPLDVTEQAVAFGEKTFQLLRRRGANVRWFQRLLTGCMRYHRQTKGFFGAYLHDPLAVAEAIIPGLLTSKPVRPSISTLGGPSRGSFDVVPVASGRSRTRLATGADLGRFYRLMEDRVWK